LDTFFAGSVSGSPQPESRDGEVKAVSFSPDGLLLAISRGDDELHIYDSRFMGRSREPMRRFLHWGDDCCLGGDRWGIVDAVWVDGWCGKGLGVITGGSDGEISNPLTHPHAHPFMSLCACANLKRLRSFLGRTQVGRRYLERRSARTARLGHWPLLRRRSLQRRKATRHVSVPAIHRFEPHEYSPSGDNGGRVYVYDHAAAGSSTC
jgi:hypothetical protein